MTLANKRREAEALLQEGKWQEALAHFKELQDSGQYIADAAFMASYAKACLEGEEFSAACRWASEAIKLESKSAYFLRGSAVLEIALRRPNIRAEELRYAQRDLRRAVKSFPDDVMAGKRLQECDAFIADVELNPPDFFPLDLRGPLLKPPVLRSRRQAAFMKGEFRILEKTSRKCRLEDWTLHGCKQVGDLGPVRYGSPPKDFDDDPDFPLGPIYVANRDGKLPGWDSRDFIATWEEPCAGSSAAVHEEPFQLRSLGEIVVSHLAELRMLGFGPAADEFCLKEPADYTSRTSAVEFDSSMFWSIATLWKVLGTTGVKPWDLQLTAIAKSGGIPDYDASAAPTSGGLSVKAGSVMAANDPAAAQLISAAKVPPTAVSGASAKTPADLKAEGNGLFKQKKWQDAAKTYEEALAMCRKDGYNGDASLATALYGNLAQCYLNLELYRRAVEAASACLNVDSQNQKALFRRAVGQEKLRLYSEALLDLEAILKQDASHAEASVAVVRIKKALQPLSEDVSVEEGSSSWCGDLKTKDRYELFVDCYRLRLEADCVGGPEARGIYAEDAKKGTILEDWTVFCKLAVSREILPKDWSWEAALNIAVERLAKPLPATTASNSRDELRCRWMRAMAEVLYGKNMVAEIYREEIKRALRSHDPNLFDDVGGSVVWGQLLRRLPEPSPQRPGS
eukprot:TRINITY_DN111029_c0_g1_i1.p1 TRINITY_DN111029_c0_g1~~TRINITY_DN111029_c0_g1_i1.p1  ORF type:complete len:682 (-),score=106.08 TRINITY_DN111029_c0_g1_i1:32-2077(-)